VQISIDLCNEIFMANQQLQSIKARFGIVGASPLLDAALETASRVAPTDLSVLITGESGVGKEVFSKIIHTLSSRKHNDFIAVNCGAIPEGTINSELFGHEKGAFTGAIGERKGYFETVSGGTIFLDEIGEMPLDTQAYLLRLLENGEFIKVGSSKVEKTDVRVIAATNVDLQDRVRKGKFREDLYYRLNTVPIKVPALHERREDISLLFRKFAYDFSEKYRMDAVRLDAQAEMILEAYRWPGNIRELKNVAEQLSVLSPTRLNYSACSRNW
jgi:transcriptional regulator with GAF, ATPase, and Fis domain